MKKNFFKKLALVMALTLAVGSVPATNVEAAAAPAFKSVAKGANLVEGQTKNYGIANVSAWSVKKIVVGNKKVATVVKSGKTAKITGVAEGKTTVRADLMAYKTKRTKSIRMSVNVKALVPEVTGVTAPLAKTIKVSGVALNKFALADVTVTGYNVLSYTAEADGKTATIVLDRMMVPNTEIEVKVADFTGKVTYNFEVAALAIVPGTFDDDLAGQTVDFTVNGETVAAQDLIDNGYSVNFVATQNGAIVPGFFADNTLGVIKAGFTDANHGEYMVKVTVSNGTTVVTSPYAPVVITDLHAKVNAINSYDLRNSTSNHLQRSTNLKFAEKATFEAINVNVDGLDCDITGGFTVASSNRDVISVSGTAIKAEKEGTATVTITYGNVKKSVPFTVTMGAREFTYAEVISDPDCDAGYPVISNSTRIIVTSGGIENRTLNVVPLDQYRDPMVDGTKVYAGIPQVGKDIATVSNATLDSTSPVSTVSGVAVLTVDITGSAIAANTTAKIDVVVQKLPSTTATQQTNTKTVLTYHYVADPTDTVVPGKTQLVINPANASESKDAVLDMSADKITTLQLAQYNKNGDFVEYGTFDPTTMQLTSTEENIVSVAALTAAKTVTVEAVGTGKATVTLSQKDVGGEYAPIWSITFTAVNNTPVLGSITYKPLSTVDVQNAVIDYTTFLNVSKATTEDAIVTGVQVKNLTTQSTVRATEAATGVITLYLDRNDDGKFDTSVTDGKPKDIVLGYLKVVMTDDSTLTGAYDKISYTTASKDDGYLKLVVYSNSICADTDAVSASQAIRVLVP